MDVAGVVKNGDVRRGLLIVKMMTMVRGQTKDS